MQSISLHVGSRPTIDLDPAWQRIVAADHDAAFGGAVAVVQYGDDIVLNRHIGYAVREPEADRAPMSADTIFDLASLTKVIVTAPAILQLVAAGQIDLEEPIGVYLPDFGTDGQKREMTIRRTLSHSSGMIGWRGVYTTATGIDAYIANLAADQPSYEPGTAVEYSCPGFILLGRIVELVSGQPLDAYAREHILAPLGMRDTGYLPDPALRDRIAATEQGNTYEVASAADPPLDGWRDYLLRGEVHDGNAWYGLHGVSGNAGLFGTAPDLLRFANCWRNGGELDGFRLLSREIVDEATREQTGLHAPNQRRGLGWQMTPHPDSPYVTHSAGYGLSARSYGHTGFTGTSLWIDPQRDVIVILLTNRVHPHVHDDWNTVRPLVTHAIANAIANAIDAAI